MRTIAHADRGDVHSLLIVLPLVLFAIAVGFDVVAMLSGSDVWGVRASVNIAAGIACAAASVRAFRSAHRARSPGSRARRKSFLFLWLSACALALFTVSLALRLAESRGRATQASVLLSIVALGTAAIAGFFGDDAAREPR